jgi:DNA primase
MTGSPPVLQAVSHFGLSATIENGQAQMKCPFHEEDTASLDIRLDNGIWNCFGCGAHGSFLDFVARMDGGSQIKALMLVNKLKKLPAPDIEDLYGSAGAAMVRQNTANYDLEKQWARFHKVNWHKMSSKHPVAAYLLGERKFSRYTLDTFDVRLTESAEYPLVIPWLRKDTLVGYVRRWIVPVPGKKKYRFNLGFNAKEAMAYYKVGGGSVLVCEGIMDLLKAAEYGYPHAACIPSWRFNESHAEFFRSEGVKTAICGLDNTPTGEQGYQLMRTLMLQVRRFAFPGKYRKDIGECNINEFWFGVT